MNLAGESGVLIVGARGTGPVAERALAVLTNPYREFASSVFLKLEVLPKAMYNQQTDEIDYR